MCFIFILCLLSFYSKELTLSVYLHFMSHNLMIQEFFLVVLSCYNFIALKKKYHLDTFVYLFKIFVFFSFSWIVFLLLGQVFSFSCFFVLFSRSFLLCSQVSHCSGFCCRAWVLEHRLNSCGYRPGCSVACRIFPDQGFILCLLHCLYHWATSEALLLFFFAAKSLQSCRPLCDPIDGSPQGSPVPGILQARTLEWVAISFSNAWKWKVKVKSLSRVWLLETPWTAAFQAPLSMGFSRQEYWSGVPSPSPSSSIIVLNSLCAMYPLWQSGKALGPFLRIMFLSE